MPACNIHCNVNRQIKEIAKNLRKRTLRSHQELLAVKDKPYVKLEITIWS